MSSDQRTFVLSLILASGALSLSDASRPAKGATYQFTSRVTAVISPETPGAVGELPFATGQRVTGTFVYSPGDAVLGEPPFEGQVWYLGGFHGLSLSIDLEGSDFHFTAPDVATPGATPLGGRPLNRIDIDDNVPINTDERGDYFSLNHSNSFFFDQPLAQVDSSAIFERFFPTRFFANWHTTSGPGQPMPEFITDFSLPQELDELFGRSDNHNWAFQFVELPLPGTSMPGRSVNVLGRFESLSIIPEPNSRALVHFAFLTFLGSCRIGPNTLERKKARAIR
jgi:hypothetical protein